MDREKLDYAKKLLERSCLNDPQLYKPVMDFIEYELLPRYEKNKGIYTADFMIRKMIMTDYIFSAIPGRHVKLGLHEWLLILIGQLADISTFTPKYDNKNHYNQSSQLIKDGMFRDTLKKWINDFDRISNIIKDIEYTKMNNFAFRQGGIMSKFLHDVDYFTRLQDLNHLLTHSHKHPSITAYNRLKNRYGVHGWDKCNIEELVNIDYFKRLVHNAKEGLKSCEAYEFIISNTGKSRHIQNSNESEGTI